MKRAAPPEASVSVVQVHLDAKDLDEVDAIATESFDAPQFSAREELRRPWTRCWVAREEGRARAFLIAWHVADELHVLSVATRPDARRRGIAAMLMRTSIEYAQEHRVRIVLLEVRRSNRPALRLYRELGFTVLGVRPGYYGDNGEDAIEMVLSLDHETGAILPRQDEVQIDF